MTVQPPQDSWFNLRCSYLDNLDRTRALYSNQDEFLPSSKKLREFSNALKETHAILQQIAKIHRQARSSTPTTD